MRTKISNQTEVKAVKVLLSNEDVANAKRVADERGMKLQAFYGMAIRQATKEATCGARN